MISYAKEGNQEKNKIFIEHRISLLSIIPEASLIDWVRVVLNTISHSGD